jgi:dephospho-CoA kinase
MRNKIIILGLVGHASGGKDTAAEYIMKKYNFVHVSTGDLLRQYVDENDLGQPTRDILQAVANRMRAEYGADYLVARALAVRPNSNIIISGLRNPAEARYIHEAGGKLLVVNARPEIRHARAELRGRPGDSLDFSAFTDQQKTEENSEDPNAQNLNAVFAMADEFIENNTSLEYLQSKIDEYIKILLRQNNKK